MESSHKPNRPSFVYEPEFDTWRSPLLSCLHSLSSSLEALRKCCPSGPPLCRNRVLPGSAAGLQGCEVHKLQVGYALWLGKSPKASEGMCMQINPRLKHVDEGAVSISLNGDEVAIALGRAIPLNSTHQVVGVVYKGHDVLRVMSGQQTNHNDAPVQKIQVARCGLTNAQGTHEDLDEAAEAERAELAKKNPEELLKEASTGARQSVMDALQDAMSKKQGQAQKRGIEQAPAPGKDRNVKAKYLDTMLGDLSGSDVSSSDEEQQ
ncbi:hypothetical protein DUNSADRAFT_1815 [Dunaliella salina]|uniref:Peptidylprolyl isomerase n=1 Tax=Dunaliella salina TaxID=3046 RepID=A0ABQ7FX08_DUNSA|nr:hypothetical protein DUNSADRAFT_1815 [Dunaliella salina]|eukprot:KAF5826891.1 hypothetical protein DUNSADRAFT_1815 [Dunaliella salina]